MQIYCVALYLVVTLEFVAISFSPFASLLHVAAIECEQVVIKDSYFFSNQIYWGSVREGFFFQGALAVQIAPQYLYYGNYTFVWSLFIHLMSLF